MKVEVFGEAVTAGTLVVVALSSCVEVWAVLTSLPVPVVVPVHGGVVLGGEVVPVHGGVLLGGEVVPIDGGEVLSGVVVGHTTSCTQRFVSYCV